MVCNAACGVCPSCNCTPRRKGLNCRNGGKRLSRQRRKVVDEALDFPPPYLRLFQQPLFSGYFTRDLLSVMNVDFCRLFLLSSDHCFQLREEETTIALITTPAAPVLGKGPPLIDKGCRCLSVSYSDSVETHFPLGKKTAHFATLAVGNMLRNFRGSCFPTACTQISLGRC